jgi:hypothetical protein
MDSNGKLVIEGIEEAFLVEGDDKEERVFKVTLLGERCRDSPPSLHTVAIPSYPWGGKDQR